MRNIHEEYGLKNDMEKQNYPRAIVNMCHESYVATNCDAEGEFMSS
jgi:hypothetical protein